MDESSFYRLLEKHKPEFHPILNPSHSFAPVDLSKANSRFNKNVYSDTEAFIDYINDQRSRNGNAFLIGGYREERSMYERSQLFHTKESPRDLHLGIDIWGDAGTEILSPMDGTIHSFADNEEDGDYGATIIMSHHLENVNFCILYGHLAKKDLQYLRKGMAISRGEVFAHIGAPHENGNWPAHLHLQVILDASYAEGDYPGVCKTEEAYAYVSNSPDPSLLLNS